jgi:quinol monooxygenase YgiN
MSRFTYLWQFHVHPERIDDFRRHYGDGGSWVQLFQKAEGYIGTRLLEDRENPFRFATIDDWRDMKAYETFRSAFSEEFEVLDRECEDLTADESLIGTFRS